MAIIDFFVDALAGPEITFSATVLRIFISMIAGLSLVLSASFTYRTRAYAPIS